MVVVSLSNFQSKCRIWLGHLLVFFWVCESVVLGLALTWEVNCDLQLDYQGFGILRARREITPGPAYVHGIFWKGKTNWSNQLKNGSFAIIIDLGWAMTSLLGPILIILKAVCSYDVGGSCEMPSHCIEPGEELFISYGTSEWFTDRGLVSQPVQTPVDRQAGGIGRGRQRLRWWETESHLPSPIL
jgi:hypothetical protein